MTYGPDPCNRSREALPSLRWQLSEFTAEDGYPIRAVRNSGIGPGFGDVDSATEDAGHFIQYLDAARKSPAIAQGKQWILDHLGLASGQWALDVGCGTGEDVVAMAALIAPDGRANGLDSSKAMVSEAIRRHGDLDGVSFVPGDAQELPFDAQTFDACRAERTLQHVDDPERAVAEMARVLRPGGRIALIEPDWEGLLIEGADPRLSRTIWGARLDAFRQARIGRRLRGLLARNGFVDVTFEASIGLLTQLALAERNFEFSKAASEAAEAGAVSDRDATHWLDDLRQADSESRFFCSALSFRAAGQKPKS